MRLLKSTIVFTLAFSAMIVFTNLKPAMAAEQIPAWAAADTKQVDKTAGIVLKKVKSVKSAESMAEIQSDTIDLTSRKRESVEKKSVTEQGTSEGKITVSAPDVPEVIPSYEKVENTSAQPVKESATLTKTTVTDLNPQPTAAPLQNAESAVNENVTIEEAASETPVGEEHHETQQPEDATASLPVIPIAPEQINGMSYTYAKVETFLSIRTWRTQRADVVGRLKPGDIVFIMADEGSEWIYVESGDARGFVSSQYLATHEEAMVMYGQYKSDKTADLLITPENNPVYDYLTWKDDAARIAEMDERYKAIPGQDIVDYAKQFVGGPYLWGGNSLTGGIDCSHFVYQVLKNTGYYSGGYTTSAGWRSLGTKVDSLSEALAGDVICYRGHVAIYDGNGKIVEAQGRRTGITDYRSASGGIITIRRFTE